MATAAVGARRRAPLLGKAASALAPARRGGQSRLAMAAAAAREHMATFAALAAADFGVFHFGHGPGWIAVGVSVLLADFAVRG